MSMFPEQHCNICLLFETFLNSLTYFITFWCIQLENFHKADGLFRYSLVLIAMYNVWDWIARYIPLVPRLKLESRKSLMIAILSRFLLIPAFYFRAKYSDPGWMIMLTSFLGVSNGYLTVCVFTVAPKGYKVS